MPPKLNESSQKDPKIRAGMVLGEFKSRKRIFQCFKNFCNRMGSNFMDYLEFEFWWMRFSAGNLDLDYDRNQDPEYRTITDMPVHVFEKICGNLGDNYQKEYWFTFRHVCKSFRAIEASLFILIIIEYPTTKNRKIGQKLISMITIKLIIPSINMDFRDLAVDDLLSVLASPGGYKLQNLIIFNNIDEEFAQKLSDKFKEIGAKIDVNCVDLYPVDPIAVNKILNLFRSIEEISVVAEYKKRYTQKYLKSIIDKFDGIDALKERVVTIDTVLTHGDVKFLLLSGLKIPKIKVEFNFVESEYAIPVVSNLLKSPHLEYCHVDVSFHGEELGFEEGLKQFRDENHPAIPDLYKYRIPDSDEFFEIKITKNPTFINGIYIERKSNSA
ncbi:hypothetical protein B9Z55_026964 [Caenorhabditis nigoni]|uniref:Mos1 transposase HTH domain-containing protein n=1 Tax=Caenorhabditis nigoni TaxID=1611254 RepID=A0A2G5SI41_9PELO|nr:hypothetical protein B9Z55_026964 [Caenorhabditis nigoni]